MPLSTRPTITPQNGDPITLPQPLRVEVAQGQAILEWEEIEREEYAALLPLAAEAVEQKRTRTGKFVIYRTGGRVCTLSTPWHSPYTGSTSALTMTGCFILQEAQASDRIGVRMVFLKGDEVYGR